MLKIATVFSGIGAFEQALKRLNVNHKIIFACDNGNINIDYDSSEIDYVRNLKSPLEKRIYVDNLYSTMSRKKNYVKQSYLANYDIGDAFFFQDIKLLDGRDFKNQIDILVGGSPCQSFSSVGSQGGLEDTRGTLFYEFARIISESQPKIFIYENVRNIMNHDKGKTWKVIQKTFDNLGYKYKFQLLDAKDFGIPQTRRRLFVVGFKHDVNFKFPVGRKLKFTMQDFLIEKNKEGSFRTSNGKILLDNKNGTIDNKYFLSNKLEKYVMSTGTKSFFQKVEIDLTVARTVLSTMGNHHRAGIDNYVTVNGSIRMLSEREAHRLMGFPDDYKIVVSRAQAYKQAGNSIVVDIFMALLQQIKLTNVVNYTTSSDIKLTNIC